MATIYNLAPELHAVNGWGLRPCTDIYSATLAATTDTTVTTPGVNGTGVPSSTTYTKFLARIKYTAAKDVFVAVNATAAVPAGASFASTTSALLPEAMYVKSGDVIHFYTAATGASVTVEFFPVFQE